MIKESKDEATELGQVKAACDLEKSSFQLSVQLNKSGGEVLEFCVDNYFKGG